MQCGVGHARAWGQKARFLRAILEIWLPYLLPWAPLDGHCQPLWLHHSLRDPQGFIFPATPNCLSLPTESTVARASASSFLSSFSKWSQTVPIVCLFTPLLPVAVLQSSLFLMTLMLFIGTGQLFLECSSTWARLIFPYDSIESMHFWQEYHIKDVSFSMPQIRRYMMSLHFIISD